MKKRTIRSYVNDITGRMKAVGTYREEFRPTMERLAFLYSVRDDLERKFEEDGAQPVIDHTNARGATNPTKNPILTARDEIYTQLLAHERELGLTPAALKKMNESAMRPEKKSGFSAALAEALNDAGA